MGRCFEEFFQAVYQVKNIHRFLRRNQGGMF
jgi:hypothetical protein